MIPLILFYNVWIISALLKSTEIILKHFKAGFKPVHPGYKLFLTNDQAVTCSATGWTFSGRLFCEVIPDCGNPPAVPNGSLLHVTNTSVKIGRDPILKIAQRDGDGDVMVTPPVFPCSHNLYHTKWLHG